MLSNLKMSQKLWLAVAAIVLILAAVVGFSGYRAASVQATSDAAISQAMERLDAANRWRALTETNAARTQAVVLSSEAIMEEQFKDVMAATSANISTVQKSLEALALSDRERAQMAKIAAARSNVLELRKKARKLREDGQVEQAIAFVKADYNAASAAYLATLKEFVDIEHQLVDETREEVSRASLDTVRMEALAVGIVLLAIIIGAYFLIRSFKAPLKQANELAASIAGGDLSQREEVRRGDEFGELLHSLYAMSDSLSNMVRNVRQSTDSIAIASAEIATGNQDLSARTEQTSSNLEETAAAMEQFAGTISQSAGSAQQASRLALSATNVARRGGEVVTQVVSTMDEINQSSKKISDIIGVIDGIAFQTNILALNAAVEAARAGEQGRGFAVVATEVRSLAGRSADAAKEIKALIGASVERVGTGSRLVQEAGTTMQDIVQSVQQVTDMIGEMTAASKEQNIGISQVNQAVGNLDQMTQQNAALVEQSAAAAQSLREQAEQLAQVVSTFKLASALESDTIPKLQPRSGALAQRPMGTRTASAPLTNTTTRALGGASARTGSTASSPKRAMGSGPERANTPKSAQESAAPQRNAPSGKTAADAPQNDDDWESF